PEAVAVVLRREPFPEDIGTYFGLLVHSSAMKQLVRVVGNLARTDAPVLLFGESGVGKEMVARALHLAGPRSVHPFVAFNCAALADDLVESELFGHERGAFTGAHRDKRGRMELCGEGTLLLDEVGCLSPRVQAKLLRVLETREFERVGGTRTLPFRGRVVSATNANLQEMVRNGAFRDDLYYRLRVVPVVVAPLRERRDDIIPLARYFMRQFSRSDAVDPLPPHLTTAAEAALVRHAWPGNVRELRSAIQYALALGDGRRIDVHDLPPEFRDGPGPRGVEVADLRAMLLRHGNDRTKTAAALGISRTTLWRRMRDQGLLG
ncbi:MAG TPA: sigma-54 dependent transcriptional regulator, partial [Myxococcota bacterium]|nr:sigma-54 dependent transcriptional regulator [Myxococcota bacterium]